MRVLQVLLGQKKRITTAVTPTSSARPWTGSTPAGRLEEETAADVTAGTCAPQKARSDRLWRKSAGRLCEDRALLRPHGREWLQHKIRLDDLRLPPFDDRFDDVWKMRGRRNRAKEAFPPKSVSAAICRCSALFRPA